MRLDDASVVADLTTQLGYPVAAGELASRMSEVLGSADAALLVAVDENDTVVGWVHVERLHILERPPTANIDGLVVDEGVRSAGIGAALLAAAEAWAVTRGIGAMQVRSRTTRERAHRFYEREGYRRMKTSYVFEKPLR